jgi:hypothetical protein
MDPQANPSSLFQHIKYAPDQPIRQASPPTINKKQHSTTKDETIQTPDTISNTISPNSSSTNNAGAPKSSYSETSMSTSTATKQPYTTSATNAHSSISGRQRKHPSSDEPNTYLRGRTRIDYALISPALETAVTAVGYQPFHHTAITDHRAIFVDFNTAHLFGNEHNVLTSAAQGTLKTQQHEVKVTYIQHAAKHGHENNLFIRLNSLNLLLETMRSSNASIISSTNAAKSAKTDAKNYASATGLPKLKNCAYGDGPSTNSSPQP